MLGLRGVRLGIAVKGLFGMQVRAIAQAAAEVRRRGLEVRPQIMIPLVGSVRELRSVAEETSAVLVDEAERQGVELGAMGGAVIELPRAALTAGHIAESAQFFSFGTNDLTQTTWGSRATTSRARFSPGTWSAGSSRSRRSRRSTATALAGWSRSPAPRAGRCVLELELGVCGEHGGDPASVHFFHEAGLDYVSCSPFRVPVARLEAGRAAVEVSGGADTA